MALSDNKIKALCRNVITPFNDNQVQSICYDLATRSFSYAPDHETEEVELQPGESIFVACNECIALPHNMTAEIVLRNSRIRQGLSLDAPRYHPGHNTRVFYRVTNVSRQSIVLDSKKGIASIIFDFIDGEVEHPYDGAFQDEIDYRGMGNYSRILSPDTKVTIENKIDSIKSIERSVYANVLSIMAVFVGVFTLVNVNVAALFKDIKIENLLTLNFTTIGSIGFLIALINTVLPDGKHKLIAWLSCIITFAVAIGLQLFM